MPKTVDAKTEHFLDSETLEALHGQSDLYDMHLQQFRALLHEDINQALEVYGFAFYFSLSDSERIRIRKQLGLAPSTAVEFYNFACFAIGESNWKEAAEYLAEALKLDPKFQEAAYNLALCYERLGQKAAAHQAWEQYLALCNDPSEKEQITAHVAELTSR